MGNVALVGVHKLGTEQSEHTLPYGVLGFGYLSLAFGPAFAG